MGRLGNYGWRPVTRLKGVSPVMRFGVNRIMARAGAMWLLQYERGSRTIPRRIVSFKVRMVRSTYPLALLLPTVIRKCWILRESHSRRRLPKNSDPLSVRIYLGFPQQVMIRWYRKSAALQLLSDGVGTASTHLEKGSMATNR